ncbi:MAG: phosphomethylpyrimidine synthase ThiC [Chloroflexota bacterium]|nr:phosphomethylpyrimidine synthase ThiC [Chloroflexota bacterium]
MSRIEEAKEGRILAEFEAVASDESRELDYIRDKVAQGEIVILRNNQRDIKPLAVGTGLRTKVNANIGTSPDLADINTELEKLEMALKAKTDTIMDLSIGSDISETRKVILERSPVPVGTVPIYQAAVEAADKYGTITKMTKNGLFSTIEKHLEDGVDFITVHCGVTQEIINTLKKHPRVMPCVSRGGSFLLTWMMYNHKENPLYENYDELLQMAKKYEATLSLGDGMRPGAIADATDASQIRELFTISELAKRALEEGVQVMIEGPGHIPIDQIRMNVELAKRACNNAPFYILGPLVTDVSPGYDHIGIAIGGALAAAWGADFLCYVTAAEHVKLPDPDEVYEGVIATRIAAHAGDIAKGVPGASQWDLEMSKAREERNWGRQIELAMDPSLVKNMRAESLPALGDTCTMCGEFCALKMVADELPKRE